MASFKARLVWSLCLSGAVYLALNTTVFGAGSLGMLLLFLSGDLKFYYLCAKTLPRDLWGLYHLKTHTWHMASMLKQGRILVDLFQDYARKNPDRVAVISADDNTKITFREMDELIDGIAAIFYEEGFRHGDVVALLMENTVEYIGIWLGLSKIGVVTALLNFNLREDSLIHCIQAGNCRAVVYSDSLAEPLSAVQHKLSHSTRYYCFGTGTTVSNCLHLPVLLKSAKPGSVPKGLPVSLNDPMLYIYTSGTTGLPKAAVIKGIRYAGMGFMIARLFRITEKDVLYSSLPLYHSNGGIALAGSLLFRGATMVVRKKFSASRFFEDCHTHKITVVNYIGETCRYLLAQPPGKYDRDHMVRLATGNGLRPSNWIEFRKRFNISQIGEFYGSSEGNTNVCNTHNKVGAVGFASIIAPSQIPVSLVQVDDETEEVVRDSEGLAVRCKPGQVGEMVGLIVRNEVTPFHGYVNAAATQKKIVRDVFKKGDTAFRSGDLLVQDEEGNFYFRDRTGDTYRWKGENVSTNEVEGMVSRFLHLTDVVSYGVDIPGTEGKAGMLCIADPDRVVDVNELHSQLCSALPSYARPIFIRIATHVETTSTHKLVKGSLKKQGYDLLQCRGDDLYYLDLKANKFQRLDAEVFKSIGNGNIRF